MSKHTPGPWSICEELGDVIIEGESCSICDMRSCPGDEAIVMADANLIAAAPDLLEACKRAMGVLGGLDMSKQALIDAFTLGRDAIVKAEGK